MKRSRCLFTACPFASDYAGSGYYYLHPRSKAVFAIILQRAEGKGSLFKKARKTLRNITVNVPLFGPTFSEKPYQCWGVI